MAKQPTKCDVCGGSTDGTPSGIKKHEATSKHLLAKATAAKVAETEARRSQVTTSVAQARAQVAPEDKPATSDFYADVDFWADLQNLIAEKEQELARRQADLNWRKRNRPEQAGSYDADKVRPVKHEIRVLRNAARLVRVMDENFGE